MARQKHPRRGAYSQVSEREALASTDALDTLLHELIKAAASTAKVQWSCGSTFLSVYGVERLSVCPGGESTQHAAKSSESSGDGYSTLGRCLSTDSLQGLRPQ